jgi:tRNA-dihydrouridine synthase B
MSFWSELELPIIGLSPMDGVTDHPTRHIVKKYGRTALMYTEFTSVEGVCHGAKSLLRDFLYDETQRPLIAQIYGTTPRFFRQTAILLCHLGFNGIDINMGCPAKNVAHSGAGAALILTPKLAQEIIRETKAGVEDYLNGKHPQDCEDITPEIAALVEAAHQKLPAEHQTPKQLPVSVKTRVGYGMPVIEEWIPTLLECEPAAIALHGRTLKQQYSGLANWELIGQAAKIIRQHNQATGQSVKILGNGDIKSLAEAKEKIAMYDVDGVLIGRATFGNPYIFRDPVPESPTRFQIAVEHAQLYEKTYSHEEKYIFLPMRKHLGWYVREFPNATQIRAELFQTNTAEEVANVLAAHSLI